MTHLCLVVLAALVSAPFAGAAATTEVDGASLRTDLVNAALDARGVGQMRGLVSKPAGPGVPTPNGLVHYATVEVVYRYAQPRAKPEAAACALDLYASAAYPERFYLRSRACAPRDGFDRFVPGVKDVANEFGAVVIVDRTGRPTFVKQIEPAPRLTTEDIRNLLESF